MSRLPWTPWHKVVTLREDLKSGALSLAEFAADLDDVAMQRGRRPAYERPEEFFALTYPTYNLRQLAKDVVLRLAGKNDKAIRQLELTYGGGKTHSLITLFHLVNDPERLPDLPAVREFVSEFGMQPPRARIAALTFDRLDPDTGMEVRAPDGSLQHFRYPWSVLAYQLGGKEGLRLLTTNPKQEREEPPFTNVLEDLLRLPSQEGLATLVLVDEVLMWARTKVGAEPVWRHRIQDFFQSLTQAATKVDTCAVVASLLATNPGKSDALGKEIIHELYAVFRREREEGVLPVEKGDVAELLRRRFFTPKSVADLQAFRPHVVAALKGICELDEQTKKEAKAAEDRFLDSYPFHPDLTDVFYTKWTNLEGFQRTRGVLRTFALALREAERWDQSPLVSVNVFLGAPGEPKGIPEAARELTTIAETEEWEGKRQDWSRILEGELQKAWALHYEFGGLKHREIEQAVFATFLHSQPITHKALTRELVTLIGATRPDRIELEKALRRWADVSWFLDEAAMGDAKPTPGVPRPLPLAWRLGSKPNLRQMHDDAKTRVGPDLVEARLLDEIGKLKSLTAGANAAGARVHTLPDKPHDVEDDGELHFAVLRPNAASEPGKPSAEARRFLDETTGPDRPRVYRNALVLAAPSRDGLEISRDRVRDYLAWEEVRAQLKGQEIDPIREQTLAMKLDAARKAIPEAVRQAYCIVVTVSDKNDAQAFRIAGSDEPLFAVIKADPRARIQETAVSADALLPDGPYALWRPGETARRVNDLVGAFAQFAHLPKMLNRKAILETLVGGCRDGLFVLKLTRPDRSVRTYWRQAVDDAALKEPGLEVVLPESAGLSEIPPSLLVPGRLPGLWAGPEIPVRAAHEYFGGGKVVKIQREGYEEPVVIPAAESAVVEGAVAAAVRDGALWLTNGPASILGEDVPPGILTPEATLQSPPQAIPAPDLLPAKLPGAWKDGSPTAMAIAVNLSQIAGKTLPWSVVRAAIQGTIQARFIEVDQGDWPCDLAAAAHTSFRLPSTPPPKKPEVHEPTPGVVRGRAEVTPAQLQDLADQIGALKKVAAGHDLKVRVEVELGGEGRPPQDVIDRVNEILQLVNEDMLVS
jgi:hypothetical protein